MAGFGYGFGAGLLGGLTENIRQGDKDRLTEASLMGDIMGLQGELGDESAGAIPTGMEPRSGLTGMLGALGLRRGGGNIEQLIMQRQALARKAAAEKQALAEFKAQVDWAKQSDFGPEEWSAWQAKVKPKFRPFAVGIQKKIEREKAKKSTLQEMLRTRTVTVPGREDETTGMSMAPTTRAATRQDIMGAAVGVEGLEDEVIRSELTQPKTERPFFIQPGPGSPAGLVHPETGELRTLPGTERPGRSVDPVMNRYRELRNEREERQNKGILTAKDKVQMLEREIRLLQSYVKEAPEDERKGYEHLLKQTFSAWNQARTNLKVDPVKPTPGGKPGGGGLPSGWKFAD